MKRQQRQKTQAMRSRPAPADTTPTWPKRMPPELAETVADRLKKSLRYAGLSQEEVATRLECHRNTVGSWCTGKSKMRPFVMRHWAAMTGVPRHWLETGQWPGSRA